MNIVSYDSHLPSSWYFLLVVWPGVLLTRTSKIVCFREVGGCKYYYFRGYITLGKWILRISINWILYKCLNWIIWCIFKICGWTLNSRKNKPWQLETSALGSRLSIVRLGPSPKLKLEVKGLDQNRTLNSHITTTTTHHQQTFLPVPGYTFSWKSVLNLIIGK